MAYWLYFFLSLVVCLLLTPAVRMIMRFFQIEDKPRGIERKIHKKKVALGGGLAIFLSFFTIILFLLFFTDKINQDISSWQIFGLLIGGIVLMIGGLLDDKYDWPPMYQLIFPVVSSLIVIYFGIGPEVITDPFGGVIQLDVIKISIGRFEDWALLADIIVFFWLMGMMLTTKLLDGLDGLVTGIVSIGALMIGFLSLQDLWMQRDIALVSFVFAGSCIGFLFWNWHPAKIFLGQGGSLFLGFILGSLAIISGGKIATTLLVMGVPVLDVGRVMLQRLRKGKSVYSGDQEHLHFCLLQSGLSHRQAVLLLYSIALLFGMGALFLQSSQRLIALLLLFILMLLTGIWFSKKNNSV